MQRPATSTDNLRGSLSRILLFAFVLLSLVAAWLGASLWTTGGTTGALNEPPRLPASDGLTQAYLDILCRRPDDREILAWDTRPFDQAQLRAALETTPEGQRVAAIRRVHLEALLRDRFEGDCAALREIVDDPAGLDAIAQLVTASPEARRVAVVWRIFTDTLGRDPSDWDRASLFRWVDSPLTVDEIATRLAAQRPLVGVHYFTWYRRSEPDTWGNGRTEVPSKSPKPVLGWYNSNDPEVMDAHIAQMASAGFDFVIVNVTIDSPPSWANAHRFFDRLAGRMLKAAVMLDGLNTGMAAVKATWVEKTRSEFTGHPNYFSLHNEPLVMVFAAGLDFAKRGIALRNVYWTPDYGPGTNTFNANRVLLPHDWPFWSPSPQPLVNGVVPLVPGYDGSHLGRTRFMQFPRNEGRMYQDQWQRALSLRPELILVYSWNEHFERTAIEPTTAWGTRYVQWTACYVALAHSGKTGAC